ncbi:tetratricopeptide repeat protein [Dyadobacter sp. CY343]|uniref:tetratricopeptide repeat protein n=1 Tax=Dyadobacter sp. CY343 TaxID=2907299 RepID=UPI001F48DFF4|nr:tetratricopeptide repeat protein [Dyadobacter sp. CY343]MCE7063400.1 tetratricopeptide repeat protein [Dyadobacter sp. CY343]
MIRYFVLAFLLFLCLFFHNVSSAQQPDEPETVISELASMLSSDRVIRTSRYVDNLRESKASLADVSYRLEKLAHRANLWNDQLLLNHVRFHQITKRGFQSALAPDDIIAVFDSARTYFENRNDLRYTGVCHFYIGKHRYEQNQYEEAFYHQAKALELFRAVGFDKIPEMGKYLHVMSINNLYFHNYQKVVQLMQSAIRLPPYNINLHVQRYNTLAIAYENLNLLDSAIYFFKRTRDIAISIGNPTWPYIAIGNLGSVYQKQGRYREALNMMMQDYINSRYKNRHPILARNTAIGIASIWQRFGQPDSVLHYLTISKELNTLVGNSEPMWQQQRDRKFYLNYYQVFHDYYKTLGSMAMAYNYLDSLTRLRNETNLLYNKKDTRLGEDRLKIQQQLADISAQQADKKRILTRFQFILGVVGLLVVILSLRYYLLRLRHSKDRMIAEKEREIQLELQKKTETRLVQANVELEQYMHHLKEKSELVETLRQQIDNWRKLPDLENQQLDNLVNQLANIKLLTPDDWNDFRKRFNQAFAGELDQLKLNYGDLTVAEERLYALEKMNVSTTQIAWMLGISKESVRKARYRLRKKINLSED